jgi:aspartyl-tRNA(Asn)/glutamyl-tRNA(Gln) amidotransferase subunit C
MSLDKATVAHIAKLARIAVPEQDLPALATELSGILKWIEQLDSVDTSKVEPLGSVVNATLRFREDKITDGGQRDAVLANAPVSAQGFFVVPKVVE